MPQSEKEYPAVIDVIRKQFGEGSIQLMVDVPNMDVEAISTGSIKLDRATGVGGIPYGRITEIFGPEGSGKTTLCQHLVANAQKEGKQCAYVDMEHALDLSYVERTGVDIKKLYISQPDTGEQALEIAQDFQPDIILVDIMMPGMNGHELCRRLREHCTL
ncbi:MAG: response regulator, partial [Nitrosopumilus sp.]